MAIRCGHCRGYHNTVEEVKACSLAAARRWKRRRVAKEPTPAKATGTTGRCGKVKVQKKSKRVRMAKPASIPTGDFEPRGVRVSEPNDIDIHRQIGPVQQYGDDF